MIKIVFNFKCIFMYKCVTCYFILITLLIIYIFIKKKLCLILNTSIYAFA